MNRVVLALVVAVMFVVMSGCEHLHESVRQTGKNVNALFFEGYQKDLYASR